MLGESLYPSRKYLDYEDKFAVAQSKVDSLCADNDLFKGKVLLLMTRWGKLKIISRL